MISSRSAGPQASLLRCLLLGAAAALGGVAVCPPVARAVESAAAAEGAAETAPLPAGLAVPYPDLSAMQPSSRRKVEILQRNIEGLLGSDGSRADLVQAFGFLGQLLHAFEKLDAAATSYESARRLDPDDARWPYYLGLIRRARGDLEAAHESFTAALALDSDDRATIIRLGNVLIELGRLAEARIHFERLERLARGADGPEGGPETAAALYGLGRIADLRGDPSTAARLFERVIELQPEAGSAHYALGQVYRGLGEVERARRHLELGDETPVAFPDRHVAVLSSIATSSAFGVAADLAAAEEDFSAEDFLGFVLSQLGPVPGAVKQLGRILDQLETSGDDTSLQRARLEYALGGLLVREGRDEESIEYFRRAVAGDPGLVDARAKLGNALARTGRLPEALEAFDGALAVDPRNPKILAKRATTLINLGRLAEARGALERAVEIDPDDPDGWRLLSGVEEREGEVERAIAAMQRAVEASDSPEARMSRLTDLGALHYRWRRFRSAASSYLEALRIDQSFVPALSRLAALLGQLQELDRAADVYGRWIALEPTNPVPRVGEATALILAGRFAAARERLEAGLVALPANLDLMDILARHLAGCPDPAIRDGARAVELALQVYQGVPTAESVATLAMAYAEAGDFAEAVSWQKRLLEKADEETPEELIANWRANLELYESGRPCCAVPGG